MDYMMLGCRIRSLRRMLGYTQEQLAEMVGISTSFMGHIERGSRKLSVDSLCRIASALDCSTDALLGASEEGASLQLGAEMLLQQALALAQGMEKNRPKKNLS